MPFSFIKLSKLTFCKLFVLPMVTLLVKVTANFKAFQIEMVFPSCRPFESEL